MPASCLIPVDGSPVALKAVEWLIAEAANWREPPQIHLLNVQVALPADISRFINASQVREYHREEGDKALATARQRLAAAGVAYQAHLVVGDIVKSICEVAAIQGCDRIVLGSHGHTGLAGTLLGSVTMKVVHNTHLPVILVR